MNKRGPRVQTPGRRTAHQSAFNVLQAADVVERHVDDGWVDNIQCQHLQSSHLRSAAKQQVKRAYTQQHNRKASSSVLV